MSAPNSFKVGGFTAVVEATPTVSTSPAYTSGDSVGGKISLSPAVRAISTPQVVVGTGTITSVIITDKAKQSAEIDVIFFDTDPSNTTVTDNGALTIHDTDLLNIVGIANVNTWKDFVDNSAGTTSATIAYPFVLNETSGTADTTLYVALVTRGTPTFASTSDITLRVGILMD